MSKIESSGATWGAMNPNSTHQRWSDWRFLVHADRVRRPSRREVLENARRFFSQLFGTTVGRLRVTVVGSDRYLIHVQIEGPAPYDPGLQRAVRDRVAEHFVARGFGPSARLVSMHVALLAGDAQDGTPPAQLLALPSILS